MVVTIISVVIIQGISMVFTDVTWVSFFMQILLCVSIPNVLFWFSFRRTSEMKYMKEIFERILIKIIR